MPKKRLGAEQIVTKLRQVEVLQSQGKSIAAACKEAGLRVPQKQPKRSRLWLNDGSCIRLRPEHPNHVWSFDFVEAATHDGRRFKCAACSHQFNATSGTVFASHKMAGR
jgi:putative transposase